MYPDKYAGTPMQAMQVVYISIWKDKIIQTNMDLVHVYIDSYVVIVVSG